MKNDGGPAFPLPLAECDGILHDTEEFSPGNRGMSLRDWFAGQVIGDIVKANREGYLAQVVASGGDLSALKEACLPLALQAWIMADAMMEVENINLSEREKEDD